MASVAICYALQTYLAQTKKILPLKAKGFLNMIKRNDLSS